MKSKGNTGFRNGNLFCFNCGASKSMQSPMAVKLAAKFMTDFAELHENCSKTWVEPSVNDCAELGTEEEKRMWWLANGEHGLSSKTIFNVLSGNYITDKWAPSDPDDFRRCYLLIKAIPEWRERLPIMKGLSSTWSGLVDNWDRLSQLLELQMATGEKGGMYELMKSLGC